MHIVSILCILLLAGLGSSSGPDKSDIQVGNWTLTESRIACDFTKCNFSFQIYELEHDSLNSCTFTVPLAQSPTAFQNVTCGSNSQYAVNGGFMPNITGVVLCLTNTVERTWAFFGFDSYEFLSGPRKNSPAYPIGEWQKRRDISMRETNQRTDDLWSSCSQNCAWRIFKGERVINVTGIHIELLLLDPSRNSLHCIVDLAPPEDAYAENWSFYNHKCRDSDWSISWAYQFGHGATVMAVADPNHQRQAWFGWSDVKSNTSPYAPGPITKPDYCSCQKGSLVQQSS